MSLAIGAGLLIVLGVALLVARPLLAARTTRRPEESSGEAVVLEDLLFQRDAALAAIRDLELDHAMGKLGDADFQERAARYRGEAVETLVRLDTRGISDEAAASDELDSWIEEAVRRESRKATLESQVPEPPAAKRRRALP